MSVSLLEVLESREYNIRNYDDALWFLSKQSEIDELMEIAQEVVDNREEE